MEKTLARAIYKQMEIGTWYTSMELYNLLGDDYYKYIPTELQGKDVRKICAREMFKVVDAGFATTKIETETYHIVRGLRHGVKNRDWSKVPTQTYTVRYFMRTK